MNHCPCLPCALNCEPRECERNATHPRPWRDEVERIVSGWRAQHLGRTELDPADVAMDLGLVGLGFVGADLHAIASELVRAERKRELPAAVVTYSSDGERMGPRCPHCLGPVERHGCGAALMSEPLPLETALRLSTADAGNDDERAA